MELLYLDYKLKLDTLNTEMTAVTSFEAADAVAIGTIQGEITTIQGEITTIQDEITTIDESILALQKINTITNWFNNSNNIYKFSKS